MDKSILRKIITDQREELISLVSRIKMIERTCIEQYKAYMESDQIKVIMGVRRCGKSILAYQLLKNKRFAYVNFDDEKIAHLAADDLNDVLEVCYSVYGEFKHILLDEAQNIHGWELFVNRLHRQGLNVTVTGSNAFLLSRELATHLTGRHIPLELYPFSFKEFLDYKGMEYDRGSLSTKEQGLLKKWLDEYLLTGGFPEVVKEPVIKATYLRSLYSDIIHKDIIVRHQLRFPEKLKDIANTFMSNTATQISYNKTRNSFHLKSTHTAAKYISFLQEAVLFLLVPRFSYKPQERLNANRKIYAIDTGMIETLSVQFSHSKGKIYENAVFLELARRRLEQSLEIYYWQNIYQHEVDFVIKSGLEIKALIQVCYDMNTVETKKREIRSLIKAGKELKCNNLMVITEDVELEEIIDDEKVKYIPLWKWLLTENSF